MTRQLKKSESSKRHPTSSKPKHKPSNLTPAPLQVHNPNTLPRHPTPTTKPTTTPTIEAVNAKLRSALMSMNMHDYSDVVSEAARLFRRCCSVRHNSNFSQFAKQVRKIKNNIRKIHRDVQSLKSLGAKLGHLFDRFKPENMTAYGLQLKHKKGWQKTWQELLRDVDGARKKRAWLELEHVTRQVSSCKELKEIREKVKSKEDELGMSQKKDLAAVGVTYLEKDEQGDGDEDEKMDDDSDDESSKDEPEDEAEEELEEESEVESEEE